MPSKVNPMKEPVIQKVTLNIGVGQGGEKLEKAVTLLNRITGERVVKTKTMKRIPAFGVRPKLLLGAKVNVRGPPALELLERALEAVDRQLKESNFDQVGNLSFGVRDYSDLPGMKYDPQIGVFGMDVCVTIGRRGYRVKKRQRKQAKVGSSHILTKVESIKFMKDKFKAQVVGKREESE